MLRLLLLFILAFAFATAASARRLGSIRAWNIEDHAFWTNMLVGNNEQSMPSTILPASTPSPSLSSMPPEPTLAPSTTEVTTTITTQETESTMTSEITDTTETSGIEVTTAASDTEVSITTTEAEPTETTTEEATETTTTMSTAAETTMTTTFIGENSTTATTSPVPTCSIEATVECIFDDNISCSNLTVIAPESLTCVLSNGPTELGWIYRGTNCNDATTDFNCTDVNGGPNENPFVNVLMRNSAGEEIFQELGVTLDETIVIPSSNGSPLDDEMSVTIFTGADEMDGVLQVMSGIQTGCNDGDNLILGTSYGALEFTSYRNDEEFVQAIQPVEWRYSVINSGSLEVLVNEVASVANDEPFLQTPNASLEVGESFTFSVPGEVSLIDAGTFTGQVFAIATSPSDGAACGASANITVSLE